MADTIEIEILDDGRIKVTTGKVSAVHHASADELLSLIATLAGGDVSKQRRTTSHNHNHNHATDKSRQK